MRGRLLLVLISLVLVCGLAAEEAVRNVNISIVPRGTVNTYLNRLATANYQVVATKKPVVNAIEKITVSEPEGKDLYFVEAPSADMPKLDGEIARFDNIIILALAKHEGEHHEHIHHPEMPDLYMEHIAHEETTSVVDEGAFQRTNSILRQALSSSAAPLDIDPGFLRQKLSELSGAVSVKVGKNIVRINERKSRSNRLLAIEYLRQEYEKIGFSVSTHEYGSFSPGTNLVAEKKGRDPSKYFVISSHYDTVSTAGADDDGTGTISCLAIAQALKDMDLQYTLRIVAFDQEEIGLVGSKAYASAINSNGDINNMIGLLQIEMLGYDSNHDGGFHVIDCNENTSGQISELVMKSVFELGLNLRKVPACTNRSDHASFWRYNKPAIVVSQNFFGGDSTPCYHRTCDRIDMIDFDYMTKITKALSHAVANVVASE